MEINYVKLKADIIKKKTNAIFPEKESEVNEMFCKFKYRES